MKDMLDHARRNGYAVGGFSLPGLDYLGAIVAAAEQQRAPVILRATAPTPDHGLVVAAAEAAARAAAVPVAIQHDACASLESAQRAINAGCNGVTAVSSHGSFPDHVEHTRRVVEMAHACGVPVEGRLDFAAAAQAADGVSEEEAAAYVERTQVDFLALSVGMRAGPKRDLDRLKRFRDSFGIPLVIDAGTSLSDDLSRQLIAHGVSKINGDGGFADLAAPLARKSPAAGGCAELLQGMRETLCAAAGRRMVAWGSAGRAAEVLAQCRSWDPVEHVIIYNVEGADAARVEAMMTQGREILGRIPGVRRVSTGTAVQEQAKYRFCWLVQFVHPRVIDSYRDHPDHVAFANQLFRPLAGDRISIDYLVTERAGYERPAIAAHRRRA